VYRAVLIAIFFFSFLPQGYGQPCQNDTVRLFEDTCIGDSVLFAGIWRDQTGLYQTVNPLGNGCDSITILRLNMRPNYNFDIEDTICEGEVYDFAGTIFESGGVYFNDTVSRWGCDSVFSLRLTELDGTDSVWAEISGDACTDGFVTATGFGASTYVWPNGDTAQTTQLTKSAVYTFRGISPCGQVIGRFTVDEACLPRDGEPPKKVYIPSAFTPNADGINDLLEVKGNGLNDVEVVIFNRWGFEIFRSVDGTMWDGTLENGGLAPSGTYVILVIYSIEENRLLTERSWVTLLR
jgi:gliding motility-associated-like protein